MKLDVVLLLMAIIALSATKPVKDDALHGVDNQTAKGQLEIDSTENERDMVTQAPTKKSRIIPIRCVGKLPNGTKYYYKIFKTVDADDEN